jgi:prepilin-type N-terminal cleavage/methylation domain-containing protein
MMYRTQNRNFQGGFTLIEISLVVIIMGLFLTTIMVSQNQLVGKSTASEAVFMDAAVAAIFKFAKINNRLPCPDINADGLEDASSGVCTSTNDHTGGIPYITLEIQLSSPVGTSIDRSFVYSVFRGGADKSKDLTLNDERSVPTSHEASSASYKNRDDFKQALINASNATSSSVDTANLYVTGNDKNSGQANCAGNKVANVAFVLAFAGGRNADGVGGNFDGPNLPSGGWDDATRWRSVNSNTCFSGPGKPITPTFDDQIRAVSFTELMGYLAQ